jgi:hypothetical protein
MSVKPVSQDQRRIEIRQKKVAEDLERASRVSCRSPGSGSGTGQCGQSHSLAKRLPDFLDLQARPPLEACGGSPVVFLDGFRKAGAGRRLPEPSATMNAILHARCDGHLEGGSCSWVASVPCVMQDDRLLRLTLLLSLPHARTLSPVLSRTHSRSLTPPLSNSRARVRARSLSCFLRWLHDAGRQEKLRQTRNGSSACWVGAGRADPNVMRSLPSAT